jgi:hypothetical protein
MKMTLAIVAIAVTFSGSNAWADNATYRKQLEDALKLQEQRIQQINASQQHDATIAKELYKLSDDKLAEANQFTAQAKGFNDAAAHSSGADKADLQAFAADIQRYADYDRTFAAERKKAADILDRQVHEMAEGLKAHQATVDRIKAKLAALK